ncbi:hypothetical protein NC651_009538 [Populus alba x Populus x berolinensis]|nr:hypothetical protein NC651_009538 [Populus alba x Populus x berolinensis]
MPMKMIAILVMLLVTTQEVVLTRES